MAERLRVNGVELAVEDSGGSGPPVLFSHGLLFSHRMWEAQIPELSKRYRCIAYDHRGQGESEVARSGYDTDTLTGDALALSRALGLGALHFVGHSMGGFVGMRLAALQPELVRSLVLMDTSPDPEPADKIRRYRLLKFIARWISPRLVVDPAQRIMHGATALSDPARAAEIRSWRARLVASNRVGLARAIDGVLHRQGARELLPRIRCPTLVMVGEEDTATEPALSEALAAGIPGSRLVQIPRAGHMSPIDNPGPVTRALAEFLDAQR